MLLPFDPVLLLSNKLFEHHVFIYDFRLGHKLLDKLLLGVGRFEESLMEFVALLHHLEHFYL